MTDNKGMPLSRENRLVIRTAIIDSGRVISYNLSEGERPGGMKVRYKIQIVSGPRAKAIDARQAQVIREVLEWSRQHRQQPGDAAPAEPVPVAVYCRTSTLGLQDPVASVRRQLRSCQDWLPAGWFIAAVFSDVESGGTDLDRRGHGDGWRILTDAGLPRDGGIADLLTEAASPSPGSPPWCARTSNGPPATCCPRCGWKSNCPPRASRCSPPMSRPTSPA